MEEYQANMTRIEVDKLAVKELEMQKNELNEITVSVIEMDADDKGACVHHGRHDLAAAYSVLQFTVTKCRGYN